MNTNKIIGIIILLIVVVGAVMLAMSSQTANQTGSANEEAMMMENEGAMMESEDGAMMQADDVMMMEEGVMMEKKDEGAMEAAAGTYTTYSADKLAMAESGDVVLFFKADWCPSCRALDADIKSQLDSIPAGVTILEVDYDSATALKQKYGVTTQHTLVQVDANGELVKKWSGGNTLNAALSEII